MGDLFFYIAAFVFVIALIVLGAWLWRTLLDRGISLPGNALFSSGREKRIGAIESASIDARRKLVLIRRDGVEHLIMTGGPVDVVIETGIEPSNGTSFRPPSSASKREPSFASPSLETRLQGTMRPETSSSLRADD